VRKILARGEVVLRQHQRPTTHRQDDAHPAGPRWAR
jgi:hypothetical protein